MKSAQVKRAEAEARQQERAKLTPHQQLDRLDAGRFTAVKERKRLMTLLLKKVDTKPIHPKHTRI